VPNAKFGRQLKMKADRTVEELVAEHGHVGDNGLREPLTIEWE
jgi:hypothetical protein